MISLGLNQQRGVIYLLASTSLVSGLKVRRTLIWLAFLVLHFRSVETWSQPESFSYSSICHYIFQVKRQCCHLLYAWIWKLHKKYSFQLCIVTSLPWSHHILWRLSGCGQGNNRLTHITGKLSHLILPAVEKSLSSLFTSALINS